MTSSKSKSSFVLAALIVTFLVAGVLSGFASSSPDGFEKVTSQYQIEESETKAWNHAPMVDYAIPGVESEALSTGLSGIAGTLIMLALGFALARFAQKKPELSTEVSLN